MALIRPLWLFLFLCIAVFSWPTASVAKIASKDDSSYLIGTGIADMTAQIAEVGFMGYAVPNQRGSGLHIRQRSRAFIIGHPTDIANRIVYVSIDFCMGFHMMKQFVIEKLQQQFGPTLYTHDNVIISGTHTHSTPGGMGGTVLVDITTFGFSKENFNAGVEGIYNSIVKAHNNAQLGTIKVNKGELLDASINRSPASYLLDPDRENYAYDTDKDMTVLRFESTSGVELGMVSFFAVHATSMNNTNTLVSGDNKGLASQLFEAVKNPHTLPGKGSFVAAFGQSNEGDVSPNTKGPKCPDGSDCDFVHSTCGGKTEGCIASGPGNNMEESTWIIANKQYEKASELYDSAKQFIHGPIDWRHTYVDMQSINVSSQYTGTGNNERTCVPALGYSFAGGTTDGPGDFDFTQGTTSPNPFWAFVSQFVAKPTQDQINCQAPKPILLDVGLTKPIEWSAYILPHQIIRVGSFWIIAVPVEMTSMSGRRLRNQVQQQLIQAGVWNDDSYIVIAGLSNSYSHYLATYEEYQLQRYEGASTLYGPHTEAAYRQIYTDIIQSLIRNQSLPSGPTPADMRNRTISFLPGVVYDAVPEGTQYGNVETQPKQAYKIGETVSAVFWCASPRNDLFTEKTFLDIEYFDSAASEWRVIADDSLWETKYRWQRYQVDKSLCTIEWTIPIGSPSGQYRINTYGVHKNLLGEKTPFTGQTNTFTVSL